MKTPPPTPFNIISLGAGVQSSTMILMAAHGEITPRPDAAVFSDTQAEPQSVYKWLDWLEEEVSKCPFPIPIYRVTAGNLTEESLRIRTTKKEGREYARSLIPFHTKDDEGSRGMGMRICTTDFKIVPITRFVKEFCKVPRGHKEIKVTQWIGISCDEIQRMKPSRETWCQHRWPLIEMDMKRHNCLQWMKAKNYPLPPRSSCVYCPYHSDHEWIRLKNEEPEEFEKAVQFEKDKERGFKSVPFLHKSCIPLDQVDFSTDEERGQGMLWGNECEGMCGV